MAFTIAPARSGADLAAAAGLFRNYAQALGRDIAYQGFEAELLSLPGAYAPPGGEILLARLADGRAVGCVALRPMPAAGCCEMKRLFVSGAARGLGIGRALVDAVLAIAGAQGYREMRLDSLASLGSALALYRAAGFVPIPPYNENPFPDAIFLGRAVPPG